MTSTTAPANHGDDRLARTALAYARLTPEQAETTIADHVAAAIRSWQLDEATFWQRVKFKARLLRAARRNGPATDDGKRHAC